MDGIQLLGTGALRRTCNGDVLPTCLGLAYLLTQGASGAPVCGDYPATGVKQTPLALELLFCPQGRESLKGCSLHSTGAQAVE